MKKLIIRFVIFFSSDRDKLDAHNIGPLSSTIQQKSARSAIKAGIFLLVSG